MTHPATLRDPFLAKISAKKFIQQNVLEKSNGWTSELESLSHIAELQPHCAFAFLTHNAYFHSVVDIHVESDRLIQDEIKVNFTKLESKLSTQFLPMLADRVSPGDIERSVQQLLQD